MTFLDELLPLVEAKFAAEERKRQYLHDPVLWAKDMLGVTLWSKQREILYSIRDNHNTAVAAGHSVGKSMVASVAMAWWADVHPPEETKILSTAPTFNQVSTILWDNLRKWHMTAEKRHREYLRRRQSGSPLGEYQYNDHALPGYITSDNTWKTPEGLVIGFGRKPPDNLLDSAFQGVHAPFLLVIGDEGAGLPAKLVEALGYNATGSANRQLIIANPTDPSSAMAKFWKDKNSLWTLMNISVFDSPPITGEEFPFGEEDGMSGWGFINEMKQSVGEDDPQYISRVLGQWSFEAGNGLFTEEEIATAANCVVIPDPEAKPTDGWDIARMGVDFTVGYRSVQGEVWETDDLGRPVRPTGRSGLHVRRIDSWSKAPLVGHDPANPGSATRIDELALGAGTPVVVVDATGMGSGVVDGLRELGFGSSRYNVLEYYGAAGSTDRRAYTNARAQHYFILKARVRAAEIDLDPTDELLLNEMRGITYEYDSRGARKLVSKDDLRRKGVKSPDYADAVVYATCDISPIIDNPLGDMKPGTKLGVDAYDMLADEIEDAEMPW